MHEFSICSRIVDAALDEFRRLPTPPRRLCKVRVVVGQLHQIVPDYLASAYDVLTRDTVAEGSEIEVVGMPVGGRCRSCDWDGELELPIFRCCRCGSFDLQVNGGSELYLDHMEVEWGNLDPATGDPLPPPIDIDQGQASMISPTIKGSSREPDKRS